MRYRALDANGDYTFGKGGNNFLVNSPQAVGQLILTRLLLLQGEWYLDTTDGTPYSTEILGTNQGTYDLAIQDRILGTLGVNEITSYSSNLNTSTRALNVNVTVNTIYGATTISTVL